MDRIMKDSGVEWLREIPKNWTTRKLKYIFRIKKIIANETGHNVLSVTQKGLKIKDISSNEGQIAMDYSKYQLVNPGDFVMNHMDLLTGWVDCSNYSGVTSPDYRVFNFINNSSYLSDYFKYIFQMCYSNKIFFGLGQGVSNLGRWRLQTDKFINFVLPVPSLDEQQKITNFLNEKVRKIDSIIENTKHSINEIKKYKQALITETVTKGLNWEVERKNSGINSMGEIPKHWEVNKLKYLINFEPPKSEVKAKNVKCTFLPMEKLRNGRMLLDNNQIVSEVYSGYSYFKENDIVLAKVTPCFENGNIAIAKNLTNGIGFGTSEIFTIRTKKINTEFLFYKLQDERFKNEGVSTMYGTGGLKRIPGNFIVNYKIAVPPSKEQVEIAEFLNDKCSHIDSLIEQKQQLIKEFEDYKKSLIYEYVTGKKEVL